jgi:solute carrier family 27 fatty acid transporter 1/4
MGSCPEYVCIWLGLSKLGIITSLINSNLRNLPLIHTLNVAKTKAVIFSHELSSGG